MEYIELWQAVFIWEVMSKQVENSSMLNDQTSMEIRNTRC